MSPIENHVALVGPVEDRIALAKARCIHQASRRRDLAFVTLTCDGLPDAVLESELFGHRRGAFPGAFRDMAGAFERAGSGTLFVARIDLLPSRLIPPFHDALATGSSHRIGAGNHRYAVTARVICTSPYADWSASSSLKALMTPFAHVPLSR